MSCILRLNQKAVALSCSPIFFITKVQFEQITCILLIQTRFLLFWVLKNHSDVYWNTKRKTRCFSVAEAYIACILILHFSLCRTYEIISRKSHKRPAYDLSRYYEITSCYKALRSRNYEILRRSYEILGRTNEEISSQHPQWREFNLN